MFQNRKRYQTSQKPKSYPQGVFLETEKGFFWVSSDRARHWCITKRVLDSWAPQRTITCSESDEAVRRLTILSKLKFRNGSLLYSQANGKMYLVSDLKLRQITDPDVLEHLNIDRNEAVWVSEAEIGLHEMGEPLDGK